MFFRDSPVGVLGCSRSSLTEAFFHLFVCLELGITSDVSGFLWMGSLCLKQQVSPCVRAGGDTCCFPHRWCSMRQQAPDEVPAAGRDSAIVHLHRPRRSCWLRWEWSHPASSAHLDGRRANRRRPAGGTLQGHWEGCVARGPEKMSPANPHRCTTDDDGPCSFAATPELHLRASHGPPTRQCTGHGSPWAASRPRNDPRCGQRRAPLPAFQTSH